MGRNTSRLVVLLMAVVLVLVFAQCGALAARGKAEMRPRTTMVVFPLDLGSEIRVAESFGNDVSTALRASMVGNGKYALFLFSERMAPMRRAKDDGTLTKNDIDGPYAGDKEKTDKLVGVLAANVYFVGSVDEAVIDAENKKASATVSGQLVDMKLGKVVKAVGVVAEVPESMGYTDDKALTSALAKAVGDQLAIQLGKSDTTEGTAE